MSLLAETMKATLVKIGDSKGIRLSKSILERYQIKDKVELILEESHIIVKPKAEPRKGWNARFKQMSENGDDALLISDIIIDEEFED